jgi:hypothetical protein
MTTRSFLGSLLTSHLCFCVVIHHSAYLRQQSRMINIARLACKPSCNQYRICDRLLTPSNAQHHAITPSLSIPDIDNLQPQPQRPANASPHVNFPCDICSAARVYRRYQPACGVFVFRPVSSPCVPRCGQCWKKRDEHEAHVPFAALFLFVPLSRDQTRTA